MLGSIHVGVTYFGAPALEFLTLLEVTEVGTINSHESCTRPSMSYRTALVLRVKMGVNVMFISSLLRLWNLHRSWR